MVSKISVTVEGGKLVIPGSEFGLEDGDELFVVKTENGLVIMDRAEVAKWSLDRVSQQLEESGAGVEDALNQAYDAMEAKVAEILDRKA